MVLGAALIAGGGWVIWTRLLLMLFYAPAALYTGLFVGGERAAAAGAQFDQAVVEGLASLMAAAYGAVLLLCGALNWRVAQASLWFCGAGVAAAAAFSMWRAMAGAAG